MSDNAIRSTTQEFLDVYDIVNDMILLKDGTAAVILQIGTMNFSLLAEQEQDAVIFTYGSLLNSLNYQIQISIQSQTKDATKYLRLLDEQITKASSDRKANLIKKYRDFVAALIKERNVLQKRFYITVPASPGEMGLISASGVLPGKTVFDISTVEKSILLEKALNILEPRKDHLTAQFNRLGLYVRQLSTQEIIQNFYINYNPEAAEGQEISSSENYTTPLVRASFGGKYMQLNQQNDTPQIPTAASTATASPIASPIVSPAATYPTPEEILSGNEAQNPAVTQAPPEEQTVLPTEPEVLNIKQTIPETIVGEVPPVQESVQPAAPTAIDQQLNPEISLSLDSSLINTNLSEPSLELPQIFAEEDPKLSSVITAPEPVAPIQDVASQEPVAQNSEPANDFAEEITPLQNNFNTQAQNQEATIEPEI